MSTRSESSNELSKKDDSATWGLAGTMLWGLFILVAYSVVQAVAVVLYGQALTGEIHEDVLTDLEYDSTALALATFATLVVCSGLIVGVIKLKRNTSLSAYLALRPFNYGQLARWLLVVVVLVALMDLVTVSLGRPIVPEFMTSIYSNADPLWLLVAALLIAAPVFEELFFRGFLLSGLAVSIMGPVGAVLVSSLAWAAIHLQYDLYGMATIFIAGVVLAVARFKTGSIYIPILMHALMNLIATVETAIYLG